MADEEKVIKGLQEIIDDNWMKTHADWYVSVCSDALALLKQEAVEPVVVAHDYGTEYKCGNCGALMIFGRTEERLSADLKRTKAFCSVCGKGVNWDEEGR